MIRKISTLYPKGTYYPCFSGQKKKKSDAYNPTWSQKLKMLSELKPYIIPFVHSDKKITKYLLMSYMYLGVSKFCFFGGPMLLKYGINGLQNATIVDPLFMFFGYGLCYSASQLFQSLRNVQILKVTSFALTETATKSYKHMLSLGPDFFFRGSQRSKLFNLYKAQNAIQMNIKSFTQYFLPFFLDVTIGSSMLLYYSNSLVMLAFIVCYAAYSVFTIKYSQYRRGHIRLQRESQRKLDFIPSQTFSNYFNVKYFGKQQHEVTKYHDALDHHYSNALRTQRSLGILNTGQRLIFGAGLTFNLIMGAYYVQHGLMTTGDLIMIQTLMMQFLAPLFFLGSTYRTFMDTFVQVKQLYDTINTPADVKQGDKYLNLQKIQGKIQFKNVKFHYLSNALVLKDFSMQIKPGQFVALVGKSGIGKSTLLNLIFRLYDPIQGEILLDDHNVKDLHFDFRRSITFVSQNPYLFNGTVMENLQYGSPSCTHQQIQHYTKILGLHDIIMELPQQYYTNVGEKGNIFSGGQKQRISLIRALLRKTKILLLDQPTSSLDHDSEQKVIQLLKADKNCTRIMITHRQNILKYVDRVIQIKRDEDEE